MTIAKLNGTLVYVQVDKPKTCFVEEKGSEWKASIVVNEEDADAWDDTFPKQTAKQVKTADFEGIYKIPAPYPDQRKQYIVTLRKNTKLGNGNDVPPQYQPKVFQQKGATLVDVTKSVLVANGSIGAISVESYEGKMGVFARLKNILVTEMIEYERKEGEGYEAGDEFSAELGLEKASAPKQEEKPVSKPAAKKATKAAETEDSPF